MAMGKSEEQAYQSLRITFGRETTESDVHQLVDHLKEILEDLRSFLRNKP
jgi:cysteine desulfurase